MLSCGPKVFKNLLDIVHQDLKNKERKLGKLLPAITQTGSAERALVPVLLRITHRTKSGPLVSPPNIYPPCWLPIPRAMVEPTHRFTVVNCKPVSATTLTTITNNAEAVETIFDHSRVIFKTSSPLMKSSNKMVFTTEITKELHRTRSVFPSAQAFQYQQLVEKGADLRITVVGRAGFSVRT